MDEEKLTRTIIGCAMKIHTELGSGFQELIYQRALAIEFVNERILFNRELEMTITYRGHDLGVRRVDFFVENKIMVELKATAKLDDNHVNQIMGYCHAYNLPFGLLINFGTQKLEFKRIFDINHPDNVKRK